MADEIDLKKLEKKAKSMLLSREIPPGKLEAVRSLMKNSRITNRERFTTIIEIIKNCPDKKRDEIPVEKKLKDGPLRKKIALVKKNDETAALAGAPPTPTETSLYIDELIYKYSSLKIFKKRYLVHRNNRLGIGFRKRLIPASKLLKIYRRVGEEQELVLSRMNGILSDILKDETIDDPIVFNYLRVMRKWLRDTPLAKNDTSSIKWMERINFEGEFISYLSNYFSFMKITSEEREKIMSLVELKLRNMDDLKKDEPGIEGGKKADEKGNLEKEKIIHRQISLYRSFLPSSLNEDNAISRMLLENYNINGFSELLLISAETLIFQRPIIPDELFQFFNITPVRVSAEKWDYHENMLKKFGKDPVSRKKREIDRLRIELEPYEAIVKYLKMEDNGKSLVTRGAESQHELIDNRRHEPGRDYSGDFFYFMDGIIHFFKNSYLPILDGSVIFFRDPDRNIHESPLLSHDFIQDQILLLNSILNDMHSFKSNNPALAIKMEEVKKIMSRKFDTMAAAEEFIRAMGTFFYKTAKRLEVIYSFHKTWSFNRLSIPDIKMIRRPLSLEDLKLTDTKTGRPLPFYDCTIKDFYKNNALTKKLLGKMIVGPDTGDGILIQVIAYLYQAAHECQSEHLLAELNERKNIIRKIDDLNR